MSEYTAAHLAGRLLAAFAGILLVRLLSKDEYALYTLILAGHTFIGTSSDLGVTESLAFFRRRAVVENTGWTHFTQAVLSLRRRIFTISLLAASCYIIITGRMVQVQVPTIVLSLLIVGIAAWLAIHVSTTAYVLKLQLRFREAYAVELGQEGVKLLAVLFLWFSSISTALAGMTTVALGSLGAGLLAQTFLETERRQVAGDGPTTRREARREVLAQVAPVLPGTVYYSLQGPLVAWLATYYGSTGNLAEVGALGRMAAVLGIVSGLTSSVLVPRLTNVMEPRRFFLGYLAWWATMLAFGGSMIAMVAIFPDVLLRILGGTYANLRDELLLSVAAAVIGSWSAFPWQVNRARGWVRAQRLRVPVMALNQLALFSLLDLGSTHGVLLFGLGSTIADLMFQLAINAHGFTTDSRTTPAPTLVA